MKFSSNSSYQWSSGSLPDCSIRQPKIKSHCEQLCLSWQALQHRAVAPTSLLLRLTQPSTLHGTNKWVSAFELCNNNKWWQSVWTSAANRPTQRVTAEVRWCGLRVGSFLALSLHSSNYCNSTGHNDSIISITIVITIIIIIRPHRTQSIDVAYCDRFHT